MNRPALPRLDANADPDLVRQALGGPASIPNGLEQRLRELIAQVRRSSRPRASLAVLPIDAKQDDRTALQGGPVLRGLGVAGLLQQCDQVAAFAVSLGPEPEALVRQAGEEGRLTDMTLLDAIASEAIESLAEQVQTAIEAEAGREARAITQRSSPGYCDWSLADQRALDELLDFSTVGVRLTDDLIMIPEKSVSAIIGIGPTGSIGRRLSERPACKQCPRRDDCPGPRAH